MRVLVTMLLVTTAHADHHTCCQCSPATKAAWGIAAGVIVTGLAIGFFLIPGVGQAAAVLSAAEASTAVAVGGTVGTVVYRDNCCSC